MSSGTPPAPGSDRPPDETAGKRVPRAPNPPHFEANTNGWDASSAPQPTVEAPRVVDLGRLQAGEVPLPAPAANGPAAPRTGAGAGPPPSTRRLWKVLRREPPTVTGGAPKEPRPADAAPRGAEQPVPIPPSAHTPEPLTPAPPAPGSGPEWTERQQPGAGLAPRPFRTEPPGAVPPPRRMRTEPSGAGLAPQPFRAAPPAEGRAPRAGRWQRPGPGQGWPRPALEPRTHGLGSEAGGPGLGSGAREPERARPGRSRAKNRAEGAPAHQVREHHGPWTTRGRLNALIGDNRRTVAALGLCSIFSGLCEVVVLTLVVEIAGTLVAKSSRVHERIGILRIHEGVGRLFLIAIAAVLVRLLLQIPLAVLPARIISRVQGQLRTSLFDAFTRASWEIQSRDREGTLQETLTGQVLQAMSGATQTTQLIVASFTFVVLLASAVLLSPIAALAVAVTGLPLFALLRPLTRMGARYAKALSAAQLNYAAGISEASRLAQETQVFGVDGAQRGRVHELIVRAERLFVRMGVVLRLAPALYQSGIYIVLVGGLALLWRSGANVPALGAAILLIVRAGTFGQQVQASYQALRQSLPFIERLQNSIDRYRESEPPPGDERLPRVESLAVREQSFSYTPDRPVLRGVSFEVSAGDAVGVVGPSGAGKSTLIQVLLRLRAPVAGAYLVNGLPAERFHRDDWHRQVAFVPQEPRLIHATVAENIRYYRDIPAPEVERAARLARIHEEIVSWPKGYETIVGPRADAVSGGQQQRICLARALAARPTVLVLDEPTSALDPHSETLIQDSLHALRDELTLFVIAHRISTLDICDRVMVIVGGELVAFDTAEMLERNNAYFRSASALAAGGALP
jgi:ATP-binding cassette subfamily B protein